MLKNFIEKLSVDLGLEQPLAPNDDGSYSLLLEPDLHLILRENREWGISVLTTLAPLPEQETEKFLIKAMSANLFGRETGGSCLGLEKQGKKVTLLHFFSPQVNYHDFYDGLEDFTNYADAWRQETVDFSRTKSKQER